MAPLFQSDAAHPTHPVYTSPLDPPPAPPVTHKAISSRWSSGISITGHPIYISQNLISGV
jgi:hypothetical protein